MSKQAYLALWLDARKHARVVEELLRLAHELEDLEGRARDGELNIAGFEFALVLSSALFLGNAAHY